jgi:hypothetical protein
MVVLVLWRVAVALREHGHKSLFNWALTAVIVVLVVAYRLYPG